MSAATTAGGDYGAGTAGTEPQREQNRAKNEFCASGPAVLATEFSFKQLQAAAEDAGVRGVPTDRSILEDHGGVSRCLLKCHDPAGDQFDESPCVE